MSSSINGQNIVSGEVATKRADGSDGPLSNVLVLIDGQPVLPTNACQSIITAGGDYNCSFAGAGFAQQVYVEQQAITTALDNTCGVDYDDMCWMQTYILFNINNSNNPLGCSDGATLPVHHSGLIAADVDQNGSITGNDVVEVRYMVLGQPQAANHPSYFFYPQSDDGALQLEMGNSLGYPFIDYQEGALGAGSNVNLDFYAVKVGDPYTTFCQSLIAKGSYDNESELDLSRTAMYERADLPTAKSLIHGSAIDVQFDEKDTYMIVVEADLARFADQFNGFDSNLNLELASSYKVVDNRLTAVLLADKRIQSPSLRLTFDDDELSDSAGAELSMISGLVTVYAKDVKQQYRLLLDSSDYISDASEKAFAGRAVHVADAFDGEVTVLNLQGAVVSRGSASLVESLPAGVFIVLQGRVRTRIVVW